MYDLIIFGSGFGGSLMSMVARRIGKSVLLIERGAHPRFAIGESTSPLTNLLLEQLAIEYDLPFLIPFTTFGAWQRSYPEVAVGMKRGFTYYHHDPGLPFTRAEDRSTQLMVAASPSNDVSDTHWYRSEFDHFLVASAIELGVEYIDHTEITAAEHDPDGWTVAGRQHGESFRASATLLIDATGPRGMLHRLLEIPEEERPNFPVMQALFTHFTDVARCDQMEQYNTPGEPPFPPDDAALHHVFDGGWMWVLRFGNGMTSAGFSVSDELASELGLPGDGEAVWQRFLTRYPSIGAQFGRAVPTRPFIYSSKLSYRSAFAGGDGWAMLPSAAAFVDPLFSTGIPLTLLGIERLGRILKKDWSAPTLARFGLDRALKEYGRRTLNEVNATAEFVGGSLRSTSVFPVFAAFSMFYFAAASYSEMARRFEKNHLASSFLAADRSDFRSGMRRCIEAMPGVMADPTPERLLEYEAMVEQSIECLNVAGLSEPAKRNWYGVDLQDVVRNAHKLKMTPDAVQEVVNTAAWARS